MRYASLLSHTTRSRHPISLRIPRIIYVTQIPSIVRYSSPRLVRFSNSLRKPTKKISEGFEWPASMKDFLRGTPIITSHLPYFGRIHIDFGTSMLNFGAITSLSGFMMTDVLWLRSLSCLGSVCGILYNVTRVPKQINAVAWGCVFISVNVVQIIRVLIERKEIKFSVEEGALYYKHFEPLGVNARTFRHLTRVGKWKEFSAGDAIVDDGKPLKDVIILVQGTATCKDPKTGETKYIYKSTENGNIIGGTALVDKSTIDRAYPNRVVADVPVKTLSFDTNNLSEHLRYTCKSCRAAFYQMMFVDLIGALRRDRIEQNTSDSGLGKALHELKNLLKQSCVDGIIHPSERRLIREFMQQKGIVKSQLIALLKSKDIAWTEQEWDDGAKHNTALFDENKAISPVDRTSFKELLKTKKLTQQMSVKEKKNFDDNNNNESLQSK